jgi:type I restriction enzyme, R subunit
MEESERLTRKRRIDPRLKTAGWSIVPFRPNMSAAPPPAAVEEWPTFAGPADYALCDEATVRGVVEAKNVVEAKKLTVGPGGVLTQAERYSRGLDQEPRYQGEFGAPFLYSTNGETIRFHDVRSEHNLSRQVAGFHAPTALAKVPPRSERRARRTDSAVAEGIV